MYKLYINGEKRGEYPTFEEAKKAYDECGYVVKFLYEPDKTYFVATLSSTGSIIGHDHMYHRNTAKCTGLFVAENKNQIAKFLEKANWHHGGSSSRSTKARLYGNRGYGRLFNSKDNFEDFECMLLHDYLDNCNINYFSKLNESLGAIDVKTYKGVIPYRLW